MVKQKLVTSVCKTHSAFYTQIRNKQQLSEEMIGPMSELYMSYLSPQLEARPLAEKGYFGVFARQPVQQGELLVIWSGKLVSAQHLSSLSELEISRSVQVEEELYLVPIVEGELGDFVNHSCNPNAGLQGQIALVALRDIQAGEEICYDYAMTDGSDYDEFECHCCDAACRQRITGSDWQLPELQMRYAGHFSPYLQRRIDRQAALKEEQTHAAD